MKIIGLDGWNIHIVIEVLGELSARVLLYACKYNYNTMGMTYDSYFDLEKRYFMRARLVKKEEGDIRRMTWVCFYFEEIN